MHDESHAATGLDLETAGVNRRHFVDYVLRASASRPGLRVLDFGCGAGDVVRLLRREGIECHGADTFYGGADYTEDSALGRLVGDGVVRAIPESGVLPFDAGAFDLVVSDHVFEHVEDLEGVLAEVDRVLAPGGVQYHHFPSREVWREGHIGVPFTHRMPRGRSRYLYALAVRRLGFGIFRNGRTPQTWARESLAWIDRWTFYRPYAELREVLGRDHEIVHREIDYCRFRAAGRTATAAVLACPRMRRPAEWLFRRLAFMALELRERP